MRLITTNNQFVRALKKAASNKPAFFYLASYKLRVDKHFDEILRLLPKRCDVKILIGVDEETKRDQLAFFKRYFKGRNVKVVIGSHLKLLVTDNMAIAGSRNYTQSEWEELSVEYSERRILRSTAIYFNKIFKRNKSLI